MIDAYATMVSERLDEEHHAESRRDLEALHRGAARTRLLVETLLNDSQAEGRALRRRPIDVDVLVRECTTLLAPEIRARDADVQVAPLPCIRGEETLIGAVFSNLLVNALKYGPRERGRVLVEATRTRPVGDSPSRVRARRFRPRTATGSSSRTTAGAASAARRAPALD